MVETLAVNWLNSYINQENKYMFKDIITSILNGLVTATGFWIHNHWVPERKLNNLAAVAKLLICVVKTYLYEVIDFGLSMLCHIRVLSESWLWNYLSFNELVTRNKRIFGI